MATFKKYIHTVQITEALRADITLSDIAKIRLDPSSVTYGIKLKPSYHKFLGDVYPLDTDLTCRLPEWNPTAVKGFLAFEEVSTKPTGTTISWRVSDGTDDYWYNVTTPAWEIVNPIFDPAEFNTEEEVSEHLPTFLDTVYSVNSSTKIQLIAKLTTTDSKVTPDLTEYRILIQAQFDWWEDLFIRSLVPRMREDFSYPKDFSGYVEADSTSINIKTDNSFKPEEILNVVGIDAVYDHSNDPAHMTDILDTYTGGTGEVTLTGTVTAGSYLWLRLIVEPEVAINFTDSDYLEIAAIPAVVLDNIDINARQVNAKLEMIDRFRDKAYVMDEPYWANQIQILVVLLTGKNVDSTRILERGHAFVVRGQTQRPDEKEGGLIRSKALGIDYTIRLREVSRYSPKPNIGDLKSSTFELCIENVYLWLRELEEYNIAKSFVLDTQIKPVIYTGANSVIIARGT